MPATKKLSFTPTGTPSTSPLGAPVIQRASEAFASASAPSASTCTYALTIGLNLSMRASVALATSTGDSFFSRYATSNSAAERWVGSEGVVMCVETHPLL